MQNDSDSLPSNTCSVDRRNWLKTAGLAAAPGALLSASPARAVAAAEPKRNYRYALNMGTIMGQGLDAAQEIEVAGRAGYDAIEPWFRNLNKYVEAGGSLKDLKKRIDDNGLTVESAIGFACWITDDEEKRAQGFEEVKRDMDTLAQLGGIRMAAPPAGVPKGESVSLDAAAERYRQILELGEQMGVIPQIEMWGGNATVGTVEKAVYIAVASGHPRACFLGDVYHTYKGGSSFDSILMLGPLAVQHYHMNDYPADPPWETIKDEHRVFPGDGIAPLTQVLNNFKAIGACPVLSLELFNREYWKMDALECARIGLEKMKAAVAAAG